MNFRQPRHHDEKHLAFIRTLPCLVSGDDTSTEACHIRYTDLRVAKHNAGVGQKPDDFFVVPLSSAQHRKQHEGNERAFWKAVGIDPVLYALALYAVSGDYERGCEIVKNAKVDAMVNIMQAG
jgi:hypothetical protein